MSIIYMITATLLTMYNIAIMSIYIETTERDHMKKDNINMYQVPIIKIYRTKQYWSDWLKYRLPIPKKITPYLLRNLLGGYK